MPRVQEEDGYHVVCDECGLRGPAGSMQDVPHGFERPPDTVGIFLCESCDRLDVGREDWLLRYEGMSLDQRINIRVQIAVLRADPNVDQVRRVPRESGALFYIVSFVRGARAPHDAELTEQVETHRTFLYNQREPTPLVERLITGLREAQPQEGGVELDFRPGSNLRLVVETVAMVIESGLTSLERTGEDVSRHLTTQLGHDPTHVAGPNLIGLVEGLVGRAYEDHRPRTEQEIREAVIRAFPMGRRNGLSPISSWINPLRQRIDYQSIARRTFLVDQLPEGALFIYKAPVKTTPLPEWCKVGLWVKRRLDNLTAHIENVKDEEVLLLTFDLPGDWQGVLVWDRTADDGCALFEGAWEPTTRPLAPTSWERILEGIL